MLKINEWEKLKKELKPDTIAIVGNAPDALNYKIGDLVDSSDLVIRMNRFQVNDDFAPFIGKKTDVFLTNFYKPDLNKNINVLKELGVKMIWSSIPYCNFVNHFVEDLNDGEVAFFPYDIYAPSKIDFFQLSPLGFFPKVRQAFAIFMANNHLHPWPVPSSGLVAFMCALRLRPKKIILAGYNFFTSDKSNYFENDTRPPAKTHHKFHHEPYMLCKLIKKNKRILFYLSIYKNIPGMQNMQKIENVKFFDQI